MSAEAQRGRVLIVDDEPDLRAIMAAGLTDTGYVTTEAANGREALGLLQTAEFDVVLSDLRMPELDGVQLLRELRQRNLDVPLILMTGGPSVQSAIEALEQGAQGYLLKPVRSKDLLDSVAEGLRQRRLARAGHEALTHILGEDQPVGDRNGLKAAFARALDSLCMAYQPIVRAGDGQVEAHEALLRVSEPTLPNPPAVLQAAERLGQVHLLGRHVRNQVATALHSGAVAGLVFVNLHPEDVLDEDLFSPTAAMAAAAHQVVLEITEQASLDCVADLPARARALRELGYRIALDDLGAGHAGLACIARLEPDFVKLDIDLVRGIGSDAFKQRVVGRLTALCRELGMRTVAEGVETEDERAALVALGCDLLQGYLVGRPDFPLAPGRPKP